MLCAGEKICRDTYGLGGEGNKKSQVCDRAALPCSMRARRVSHPGRFCCRNEPAGSGKLGRWASPAGPMSPAIKVSSSARCELLRVGIICLGAALAANPPGAAMCAGWRMDG